VEEAVARSCPHCPHCSATRREFRVHCVAVLLTFNGLGATVEGWAAFQAWVRENKGGWGVLYNCATVELCKDGSPHYHLMLQFRLTVDRPWSTFAFQGVRPNCRPSWGDLCGEGFSTKSPQLSFNRGFFYVWADKIGTVHEENGEPWVWANYAPVWTNLRQTYEVRGKWPETLWKQRKLDHAKYQEYLFAARDGVVARARNLRAVTQEEREAADKKEMGTAIGTRNRYWL